MKRTFFKAILEVGLAEPKLCFVFTGEADEFVEPLRAALPDRVVLSDEGEALGVALGLLHAGKIPVAYLPSGRATARGFERIQGKVCATRANIKMVVLQEGLAIPRLLPHLHVLVPSDESETHVLTEAMVKKIDGPCWLRLDNTIVSPSRMTETLDVVPFLPRVLRQGKDIAIFGSGGILNVAFEIADELQKEGVETRIISVHGLRPFAAHALSPLMVGMRAVFTLEAHEVEGGLGGAFAEWLAETGDLPPVFYRFGAREGDPSLTAASLCEKVRFFLSVIRSV